MHKGTIWLTLLLNACASAAAYRAPQVEIPSAFRERLDSLAPPAPPPSTVPAVAGDTVSVGEYWRSLGDSTLNRLLDQALSGNLDVEAARARIRGARAVKLETTLDFVPTVTAIGGYTRQRLSGATF